MNFDLKPILRILSARTAIELLFPFPVLRSATWFEFTCEWLVKNGTFRLSAPPRIPLLQSATIWCPVWLPHWQINCYPPSLSHPSMAHCSGARLLIVFLTRLSWTSSMTFKFQVFFYSGSSTTCPTATSEWYWTVLPRPGCLWSLESLRAPFLAPYFF